MASDTPNQMPIGSKVLSDHMFVTLEYFSPTKEYNGFGWLLLSALKKVGKGKDELRASDSQLELCIDDLKASISALKETHKARVSENQTQSLILQVGDRDSVSGLWQIFPGESQCRHLRFWSTAWPSLC